MTNIPLLILILLVGIALLLLGGDLLVRGAVAISRRFGVAPLIIGLTVVAFGTSAPELALNIVAALSGSTDLSFGNIVGSNIANIGLILGLSALIRPMKVHASIVKRELPIMLLASGAMLLASYFFIPASSGPEGDIPGLARLEGVGLLLGFVLFLALMLLSAVKPQMPGIAAAATIDDLSELEAKAPASMSRAVAFFILGLLLLLGGGKLSEMGAVGIARGFGITETMIGLTVVAVATSLPELATSLIAARRGETDIAVGNIVGSNIFNILLIMGLTATIAPVPLPAGAGVLLAVMTLLSVVLLPMSFTASRTISRIEGFGLLAVYATLMGYEVWRATV